MAFLAMTTPAFIRPSFLRASETLSTSATALFPRSSRQYSADARSPPGFMRISEALRRLRNAMAAAGTPSLQERRVEGVGWRLEGIISEILRELSQQKEPGRKRSVQYC